MFRLKSVAVQISLLKQRLELCASATIKSGPIQSMFLFTSTANLHHSASLPLKNPFSTKSLFQSSQQISPVNRTGPPSAPAVWFSVSTRVARGRAAGTSAPTVSAFESNNKQLKAAIDLQNSDLVVQIIDNILNQSMIHFLFCTLFRVPVTPIGCFRFLKIT